MEIAFPVGAMPTGRSRSATSPGRIVWIRRAWRLLVLGLLVAAGLTISSQWGTLHAGIDAAVTAVAAVLLYRILSFWILAAFGWATVGGLVALQRREARRAASPS